LGRKRKKREGGRAWSDWPMELAGKEKGTEDCRKFFIVNRGGEKKKREETYMRKTSNCAS